MHVGLLDLSKSEVRITSRARGVTKRVYNLLREISSDSSKHGKLQGLVTFTLTNDIFTEKGKAAQMAVEMRRMFGNEKVAGFKFFVSRAEDDSEEYLSVVYRPGWIVPGEWEKHKVKLQRAKERKRNRGQRDG